MSRRCLWAVLLLLACLERYGVKAAVRADLPRKAVEIGKKATVMVETREATGTAFCISAAGDFVTNQHVIGNVDRVTLILNSGGADQKIVTARVVESDPKLDLALLTAEKPGTYTPLPLAQNSAGLIETAQIAAFGFPYGKKLTAGNAQYPSISVSIGRVTALRKNRGLLKDIQIDAAVAPGSSGGPLLDEQGHVVGIVAGGVKETGIHVAIPIEDLQTMLLKPHISMDSPTISRSQLRLPNVVRFRVAAPAHRHIRYDVTFTRFPRTDQAVSIPVSYLGNDTYVVTTVPVPARVPPSLIQLTTSGANGSFVAMTKDREIHIGKRTLYLHDLEEITGSSPPSVSLRGGTVLRGPIVGLQDLPIFVQGVPAKLNFGHGQTFKVVEFPPASHLFAFELVVRHDGKILLTQDGMLNVDPAARGAIREPQWEAPRKPQTGGQVNGPISFRDPIVLTIPGMRFYTGLRLADLDHDGHLDILVTAGPDLVVLYGHGDGKTFDTVRYPMGVPGSPIRIADLNHDGREDVVVSGGQGVQVLLRTGPRTFAAPQSYPTGEAASCVTVGDFNRDGSPDLAVTNIGSANFAVLLNGGDGTFGTPTLFPTPQYPVSIASVNLQGARKLDLMVNCFHAGGTLHFAGDGHGNFRQADIIPNTGGGQLLIADLNGDVHPELVGLNFWSGGLGIRWGVDTTVFGRQGIATKQYPSQIDIGDLDGDGRLDLIFGNQGSNLFTVCLNGGDSTMKEGLTFTVPDGDVRGAVIGDLNEDGNNDVVADGGADHLFLLLNGALPIPADKRRTGPP